MDLSEFLKTIVEDNLAIAKYLGWERDPKNENRVLGVTDGRPTWKSIKSLDYHTSWNTLMEVVQRIEETEYEFYENDSVGSFIDFHIMPDAILVCHSDNEDEPLVLMNKSECKGSIETEPIMFEDKFATLYRAVVVVVKWLNERIEKNGK